MHQIHNCSLFQHFQKLSAGLLNKVMIFPFLAKQVWLDYNLIVRGVAQSG